MRNLTKIMYILGFSIIGISWLQWFFKFPDPSQLFLGTIGGICIIGFAYIHNWMVEKDEVIKELDKALDLVHTYAREHIEGEKK